MRETIGGYRVLGKIGSGSYGAVYRVRDPLSDRDVALKLLTAPNDLAPSDIARFRREARLPYEIGHPNLIDIIHYGEDGDDHFIVMELMPSSLRDVLEAGTVRRLPLSRAVDICRQAALGLKAAHDRKVFHRDIKPENILIDANGVVKVSDFGIARAENLTTLTTRVSPPGTPAYASPEQALGRHVDFRTDIYSLGAALYEMLIGWGLRSATQRRTELEAPFGSYGKMLSVFRRGAPIALQRIVDICLSDYPDGRYQTMDELLQEIANPALINRCALVDFYEATNGDNWRRSENWLTDKPLNDWYGVTASHDGVVTEIDLGREAISSEPFEISPSGLGLEGEIPREIAHLTELERLDLADNRLSGDIPSELCGLTKLERLRLDNNSLAGNIPPELGGLTKLEWLYLNDNDISGDIPPELGGMTELEELQLNDNNLSGNIPPELGGLTKLEWLDLNGNHLTGNIPPELGNLTKLGSLVISGNHLMGSIPPELGSLTELALLFLGRNGLTGSIPPELGGLTELESLDLSRNGLTGSIPPELGGLTELEDLDLSRNGLSGSIPPEIGNLTKLGSSDFISGSLDLSRNSLSGSIPPELGRLTELESLDLSRNSLSGNIPPELGGLTELGWIELSRNSLSGDIPPELCNLTKLETLNLRLNRLSGSIPSELCGLTELGGLFLAKNNWTGCIPRALFSIRYTDLDEIDLPVCDD